MTLTVSKDKSDLDIAVGDVLTLNPEFLAAANVNGLFVVRTDGREDLSRFWFLSPGEIFTVISVDRPRAGRFTGELPSGGMEILHEGELFSTRIDPDGTTPFGSTVPPKFVRVASR